MRKFFWNFVLLSVLVQLFFSCTRTTTQQPIKILSTAVGENESQKPLPSLQTPTQTPSTKYSTTTSTSNAGNSILISYEQDANDSIDRYTACLAGLDTFSFILYENGRVILFDESKFVETMIPQTEIEKLLAAIESTGFFLINGGGDEFISIPPTPFFVGESMQIVTVKGKKFVITAREYQYLVEPIKETIQIVRQYKPPGSTPYLPDKLYIWVYPIQDTALTNYDPAPTPPTLEWSYESIPLDTLVFTSNEPSKIISDKYLQFVLQEFKTFPAYRMVKQNGQHYLIMTCPAFE